MIEAFEDYMDSIFWEGFTEQLKKEEPDRFSWEYAEFIKLYT